MIVRNEAANIIAVLDSVRDAVDRVTILDTGSDDGTPDLVRGWLADAAVPGRVFEEPFIDYATTRNRSLDLAERESLFSLVLSGDEYLGDDGQNLRQFLREQAYNTASLYDIRVQYAGNAFDSARVVRNAARPRYVGVVHETFPEAASFRIPSVTIAHRGADVGRKNDRIQADYELLLAAHSANPTDPRTVFYLAQALRELGRYDEAISTYQQRIALGGFHEEVYESMYRIGCLCEPAGRPWAESEQWFLTALAHSHRAEPLFEIALHHHRAGDHALAYSFASRGLEIPYPEHARLFVRQYVYKFQLHDLVAMSALFLGDALGDAERALAIKSARIVVRECPMDGRARYHLQKLSASVGAASLGDVIGAG